MHASSDGHRLVAQAEGEEERAARSGAAALARAAEMEVESELRDAASSQAKLLARAATEEVEKDEAYATIAAARTLGQEVASEVEGDEAAAARAVQRRGVAARVAVLTSKYKKDLKKALKRARLHSDARVATAATRPIVTAAPVNSSLILTDAKLGAHDGSTLVGARFEPGTGAAINGSEPTAWRGVARGMNATS